MEPTESMENGPNIFCKAILEYLKRSKENDTTVDRSSHYSPKGNEPLPFSINGSYNDYVPRFDMPKKKLLNLGVCVKKDEVKSNLDLDMEYGFRNLMIQPPTQSCLSSFSQIPSENKMLQTVWFDEGPVSIIPGNKSDVKKSFVSYPCNEVKLLHPIELINIGMNSESFNEAKPDTLITLGPQNIQERYKSVNQDKICSNNIKNILKMSDDYFNIYPSIEGHCINSDRLVTSGSQKLPGRYITETENVYFSNNQRKKRNVPNNDNSFIYHGQNRDFKLLDLFYEGKSDALMNSGSLKLQDIFKPDTPNVSFSNKLEKEVRKLENEVRIPSKYFKIYPSIVQQHFNLLEVLNIEINPELFYQGRSGGSVTFGSKKLQGRYKSESPDVSLSDKLGNKSRVPRKYCCTYFNIAQQHFNLLEVRNASINSELFYEGISKGLVTSDVEKSNKIYESKGRDLSLLKNVKKVNVSKERQIVPMDKQVASNSSWKLIREDSSWNYRLQHKDLKHNKKWVSQLAVKRYIKDYIVNKLETGFNANALEDTNICTFCKANSESFEVYTSHKLKKKENGVSIVTCPILRKFVCPKCNATGDMAHTLSYCPVVIKKNNGKRPQSLVVALKESSMLSCGKPRKL